MLNQQVIEIYNNILKEELIEATGCTEPIALAYAGAIAKKYLKGDVKRIDVFCSGNMIKNVHSVTVPNSGGLKGINAAVGLGFIAGDAENKLQVISKVNENSKKELIDFLTKNIINNYLERDVANLYIRVEAFSDEHSSLVKIEGSHTNVTRIECNKKIILDKTYLDNNFSVSNGKEHLNIDDIIEYANNVELKDIESILNKQIEDNTAIALEGTKNKYGSQIGRNLYYSSDNIRSKARALAAAGSDARMNGCPLPVVINSGSGNQGLTITLPIVTYGEYLKCSKENIIRALAMANLISVHQKKYIGSLSCYCGATSAAAASACGICYLKGGTKQNIKETLVNTIATIGGMICDGAKSSCAAKISIALESALQGLDMAMNDNSFVANDGIVKKDVEDTIKTIGTIAKNGMKETDRCVIESLLEKDE